MALTLLPINATGAALVLLALILFALEVKIASHGILGAGGTLALILGAVILVDTGIPELRIQWSTAVVVAVPFALITMFLLRLVLRSRALKVTSGIGGLLDEVGIAKTDLDPEGSVFVHGEWWNAVSPTPVRVGTKVRVLRVDGLRLTVAPADDASREDIP